MSRAFVGEGNGALDPLPDLPILPHRHHVTPRGLAALRARLQARQTALTALRPRAPKVSTNSPKRRQNATSAVSQRGGAPPGRSTRRNSR